jgi:hypothetical protein
VILAAVALVVAAWSSGAAAASSEPLPLSARLLKRGELAGFARQTSPTTFTSARLWVQTALNLTPAKASAQVARLHREGFKGLRVELLDRRTATEDGVSWVMQLGSPASARAELAATFDDYKARTTAKGGSFWPYTVPAIPGARGYRAFGSGQVGENVFFADGPFLYLVGAGWVAGEKDPPTRAGVIAAATKLYRRVHGHPAA